MNRKDLQAFVGTPRDNSESDPLAVLHLNNWLYINHNIYLLKKTLIRQIGGAP